MRTIIPDTVNDSLIGILLISHNVLAEGAYMAARMIMGEFENVAAVGFDEDMDPDAFGDSIAEMIGMFPAGCVVLCDLFGGTPFNQLLLKGEPGTYSAVTGLNLSMLLETISSRDECETVQELARTAREAGDAGVVDVMEYMKQRKKQS